MPFTINLTDYKMLYPDTAEFPTLSQSGLLALLLAKHRIKAARAALRRTRRQERRRAVRAWWGRCWAMLQGTIPQPASPVFARADRNA